ncbi:uncharacterized protein PSANT_01332 [Moesziomyces antarcticus]|uniref:Uncharacterized protein n=1 Tax=Pseudozyma antarctica TaxID=84753 RepID=A0A5C3FJ19_PSEA2|nr:uncharacterized protein PSANT_01332 [Moesziomyces antarcticus]
MYVPHEQSPLQCSSCYVHTDLETVLPAGTRYAEGAGPTRVRQDHRRASSCAHPTELECGSGFDLLGSSLERERLVRIPEIKISEPNRIKLGAIDAELVSRTSGVGKVRKTAQWSSPASVTDVDSGARWDPAAGPKRVKVATPPPAHVEVIVRRLGTTPSAAVIFQGAAQGLAHAPRRRQALVMHPRSLTKRRSDACSFAVPSGGCNASGAKEHAPQHG